MNSLIVKLILLAKMSNLDVKSKPSSFIGFHADCNKILIGNWQLKRTTSTAHNCNVTGMSDSQKTKKHNYCLISYHSGSCINGNVKQSKSIYTPYNNTTCCTSHLLPSTLGQFWVNSSINKSVNIASELRIISTRQCTSIHFNLSTLTNYCLHESTLGHSLGTIATLQNKILLQL